MVEDEDDAIEQEEVEESAQDEQSPEMGKVVENLTVQALREVNKAKKKIKTKTTTHCPNLIIFCLNSMMMVL
jgi:hypothetical protein